MKNEERDAGNQPALEPEQGHVQSKRREEREQYGGTPDS